MSLAVSSVPDAAPAPDVGRRVKMLARPLLERMNFDEALVTRFGTDFMDTLKIEQMQGGPDHGMFVAHDALAVLKGMQPGHAARKIKDMAKHSLQVGDSNASMFPSCKLLEAGHGNGAGEVVLLNLEDLVTMLLSCNIPGLTRAAARNSINIATGAAAPQAIANALANDATAHVLQAGAAAGGAEAVPALAMPPAEFMGFMTDMRSYMQSQALINGAVSTVCVKINDMVSTQAEMKAAQAQLQTDVAQVQAQMHNLSRAAAANAAAPGVATAPVAPLVPAAVAAVGVAVAPVAAAPVAVVPVADTSVDYAENPAAGYRKNQKYRYEAKQIVCEWLVSHVNNPYPTAEQLAELCQKCDIADAKRMGVLVNNTRHQQLVKGDGRGRRCKWSLPRRNWVQTSIGDQLRG